MTDKYVWNKETEQPERIKEDQIQSEPQVQLVQFQEPLTVDSLQSGHRDIENRKPIESFFQHFFK